MELFIYLLKASGCMAVCYLLYITVFRRFTFFSVNRYYLLLMVIASLLIPAMHIKVHEQLPVNALSQQIISKVNLNPEAEDQFQINAKNTDINWLFWAQLIYIIVCIAVLAKLLYGIIRIIYTAKSKGIKIEGNYIINHASASNSSFFNIIFINTENKDNEEFEQVLAHEKAHGALMHSLDNLFLELVKVFFWFNPFVYLISRSLKEIHEFEVDNSLTRLYNVKGYASLLLKLSLPAQMDLLNRFSAYSLKSRVHMLFKPQSSKLKKWYYLLILPFFAIGIYYFSIEKVYGYTALKKDFVLVLDAGHGGKNNGAIGGGYTEKDLNLQLVKQIKTLAEERGIHVILTRTDDEDVELADRVKNKGDLFISIHLNSTSGVGQPDKGTEILVDRNTNEQFSEKLAAGIKTSLQSLQGINYRHPIDIFYSTANRSNYVLRKNPLPAVLVELGYISDKGDRDFITNKQNQTKIAEKFMEAINAYRSTAK